MKKAIVAIKEFFQSLADGFRFLPILWGMSEEEEERDGRS